MNAWRAEHHRWESAWVHNDGIKVEVLARERGTADGCLAELRTSMRKRNVCRGHVVSLAVNEMRQLQATFHRLPQGEGGGCAPLLFELLNQMDGLADDADILFVLTTNRPDRLEPALAALPGRIDQAVEVPLPDADCRRRLFGLYGRGLKVTAPIDPYIERTAGASASFIRELLRKSALFAADEGGDLMKSLLGASNTPDPPQNQNDTKNW